MNGLFFPSSLKLINLTPFKISVCKLISLFLKDENLNMKCSNIILFDVLAKLMYDYKCEISKFHFYEKLAEIIKIISKNKIKEVGPHLQFSEGIFTYLKIEVEKMYESFESLNDIYAFLNIEIKELKSKNENGISPLENGGVIDSFIRKCLFAFYKMSFEDTTKLFSNFKSYIIGEEIKIQLTNKESEYVFEKQLLEYDRKGWDEVNNKILHSYNYKHKFYFDAKKFIVSDNNKLSCKEYNEESINNIHKFFDYNMKYLYSDGQENNTKIHYALMNVIEFYYREGFYEKAINVLFECIKLNQSNTDHEGLLKCFIWIQKIYIILGKFEPAVKCISTCIIKSFENNFHLIYLISTTELAFLNYYFNSNIGDKKIQREYDFSPNNSFSFEENILSYSYLSNHSYKNILQLLSISTSDYLQECNPKYYFKYIFYNIILNLQRKGNSSLAISFLKKLIDYLFIVENKETGSNLIQYIYDFTPNNPNFSIETIETLLLFLSEVMEYDVEFSLTFIWKIVSQINSKNIFSDFINLNHILDAISVNFFSLSGLPYLINLQNLKNDYNKRNVYKEHFYKYMKFQAIINSSSNLENLEQELINFLISCKQHRFGKLKLLSTILISKIYITQEKFTEAIFLLNKILKKSDDNHTKIKANLILAGLYLKTNKINEVRKFLCDIENSIDNYGSILDRYEYNLILGQLKIKELQETINYEKETISKLEKSTITCICKSVKFAIQSNSIKNIKISTYLISLNDQIRKTLNDNNFNIHQINTHSITTTKILSMFGKLGLSPLEKLEIIYTLMNFNKKLFEQIKYTY